MNQPISVKDLVDLLRKDHPGWTDAVLDTEARSMRETLDPRLAASYWPATRVRGQRPTFAPTS